MSNVDVTRDAPRVPLPPIDPNVNVPEAVRRAAQNAENYYKKPDVPAPPAGQQPAVAGDGASPIQQVPGQAPAPAPAPEPAPQVTGAGNEPPDEQSWEHRYKSMQGRFQSSQAQLRQMQETVSQLGNELGQQTEQVGRLTAVLNRQPPARTVTEEDRTSFGDEFLDAAARAAQDALSPEVAELKEEVGSLKQTLQRQAEDGVRRSLTMAVPNWRAINTHPLFNQWLGLRDPISGAIRKTLLDGAFRAADAARVIAIFQGFLAADAASRPAVPAPRPDPASQAPAPRVPVVNMETLAAPGRARSSPAIQGAGEKPVYTRADISYFYSAAGRSSYAGRDADRRAAEADLFAAQREGRVRG